MEHTLLEPLGGRDGITRIAEKAVANQMTNHGPRPASSARRPERRATHQPRHRAVLHQAGRRRHLPRASAPRGKRRDEHRVNARGRQDRPFKVVLR